jgi:FkbM family methyltransferase
VRSTLKPLDTRFLRVVRGNTIPSSHVAALDFCGTAVAKRSFDVLADVLPAYAGKDHKASVRALFGTGHVTLHVRDPKTDSYISGALMAHGTWETEIVAAMRRVLGGSCSADKLFVDVGANVGYFSAIAAASGCRVVSVEPVEAAVRCMHQTQHQQSWDWTVYRNAASDVTGDMVQLQVANARVNAGNYKIHTARTVVGPGEGGDPRSAATIRLDDIVSENIMLLKVDVEGYEPHVLAGAANLFCNHTVYAVIIEVAHDVERSGCDWQRMLRWLRFMGYGMRALRTGAVIQKRESNVNILFVLEDVKRRKPSMDECLKYKG